MAPAPLALNASLNELIIIKVKFTRKKTSYCCLTTMVISRSFMVTKVTQYVTQLLYRLQHTTALTAYALQALKQTKNVSDNTNKQLQNSQGLLQPYCT